MEEDGEEYHQWKGTATSLSFNANGTHSARGQGVWDAPPLGLTGVDPYPRTRLAVQVILDLVLRLVAPKPDVPKPITTDPEAHPGTASSSPGSRAEGYRYHEKHADVDSNGNRNRSNGSHGFVASTGTSSSPLGVANNSSGPGMEAAGKK